MTDKDKPDIVIHDSTTLSSLPLSSRTLFEAKARKQLSFADLATLLGRSEVGVAALFYGQARASPHDVQRLARVLDLAEDALAAELQAYPERGRLAGPLPPRDPLVYRLYEIIHTYGFAYKAVLNEMFGDGIMSAVAFETKVNKEVDELGNGWAVITLRGKWLPFPRF